MSNRTTYVYDGHDRLSRTRMPAPGTDNASSETDYEELTYLTVGSGSTARSTPFVASRRTRAGQSIGYSYDNLGRVTDRDLPSGAWFDIDRSYTYDLMGRLISAYAPNMGTVTLSYDAFGRLTAEAGPLGTTSYGYDAGSRRTSIAYPGTGLTVGYSFDTAGNMLEIRENPSGSNALLASYAYDSLGRRSGLTRGNGATTSYSHDAVSRLTQIVQNPGGTSYDLTLDHSYNPAGQIVSTTRSNDAYAWGGHYEVNRGYTANGRNQYSQIGSTVTPSYDANGNMTSTGSGSYDYNAENRLTVGPGSVQLIDDGLDRLYRYYDGRNAAPHDQVASGYSAAIWAASRRRVSRASATAAISRQAPSKPGPGARRSASR